MNNVFKFILFVAAICMLIGMTILHGTLEKGQWKLLARQAIKL